MEKSSTKTIYHSLSLAEHIALLFLYMVLDSLFELQKLSLRCISFISSCSTLCSGSSIVHGSQRYGQEDPKLSREDLEMVLEKLRLGCREDVEEMKKEYVGFGELSGMFEEKEPNLEEVREAFGVFDENCDGFIDSIELQRVLSKLGFGEGSHIGDCRRMIAVHDENGDGRIDFDEFVKFMETCFC